MLLPLLGFPHAWESFFQVLAGLSIVLFSVWAAVDKKITLKAKAERRQRERRRLMEQTTPESEVESVVSEGVSEENPSHQATEEST